MVHQLSKGASTLGSSSLLAIRPVKGLVGEEQEGEEAIHVLGSFSLALPAVKPVEVVLEDAKQASKKGNKVGSQPGGVDVDESVPKLVQEELFKEGEVWGRVLVGQDGLVKCTFLCSRHVWESVLEGGWRGEQK